MQPFYPRCSSHSLYDDPLPSSYLSSSRAYIPSFHMFAYYVCIFLLTSLLVSLLATYIRTFTLNIIFFSYLLYSIFPSFPCSCIRVTGNGESGRKNVLFAFIYMTQILLSRNDDYSSYKGTFVRGQGSNQLTFLICILYSITC